MRQKLLGYALVASFVFFCTFACVSHPDAVWIVDADDTVYRCPDGGKIYAAYHQLSDKSLSFVRLALPTGEVLTLAQEPSASGVRYSDGISYVWWTKGPEAFLEKRNDDGEWARIYARCVEEPPRPKPESPPSSTKPK